MSTDENIPSERLCWLRHPLVAQGLGSSCQLFEDFHGKTNCVDTSLELLEGGSKCPGDLVRVGQEEKKKGMRIMRLTRQNYFDFLGTDFAPSN